MPVICSVSSNTNTPKELSQLIPKMTSNTSSSGVAFCSGIHNGDANRDAWHAFDGNPSSFW
jgi:hypothetical protein